MRISACSANYHQALIADVAGHKDQAAQAFKAAYDADKNTLRLVDAYARFLSGTGKNDEATDVYTAFDRRSCRIIRPSAPRSPSLKDGKTLAAAGQERRSGRGAKCSMASAPRAAVRATNSPG